MDSRPILPLYLPRQQQQPYDDKYAKERSQVLSSLVNFFVQPKRCFGLTFRLKQKYLVLVALCLFLCFALWNFSLLPRSQDEPARIGLKGVLKGVLDKIPQDIDAHDFVLPRPMDAAFQEKHGLAPGHSGEDVHVKMDRERFKKKMNTSDQEVQIPRPRLNEEQRKIDERVKQEIDSQQRGVNDNNKIVNQEETDENHQRRQTVKNMMIHAWDNYKKYAWGSNELRPISKSPHSGSVFGAPKLGATIIDALDTLYIMGLMDRFDEGRKFVEMSFDFSQASGDISVFETTIRFVGGLLACYALTEDELFKAKAVQVADLLLPAFETPSGIPFSLINVETKSGKNYFWASGGSSILSEFGTLHLEFDYLSKITNNSVYSDKAKRIRKVMAEIDRPNGLFYNYVNPRSGGFSSREVSMGALGDSFYEYLLKSWVMNRTDTQGLQLYESAMAAFERSLFFTSQDGLFYIAELKHGRTDAKMDHLACFAGGMFALHSKLTENQTAKTYWMEKAQQLTHTCHESYIRSDTHLGPESFRFTNEFSAKSINDNQRYYILRPEVIEAYFYLWRTTKDPKYRDWAWDAVQAIEKYCRTPSGYSGIRDVYSTSSNRDDVQQSFFLAETLKYLYLIFSDDDVISLDKFVFNTEAHPLPIYNSNNNNKNYNNKLPVYNNYGGKVLAASEQNVIKSDENQNVVAA